MPARTAPRKSRKSARRPARKAADRKPARSRSRAAGTPGRSNRWSKHVMETSDALDLEAGVFKKDTARAIAVSLMRSAEASRRRKTDAFRSAMSMLNFYINRAGRNLPDAGKAKLENAKQELRRLNGK